MPFGVGSGHGHVDVQARVEFSLNIFAYAPVCSAPFGENGRSWSLTALVVTTVEDDPHAVVTLEPRLQIRVELWSSARHDKQMMRHAATPQSPNAASPEAHSLKELRMRS